MNRPPNWPSVALGLLLGLLLWVPLVTGLIAWRIDSLDLELRPRQAVIPFADRGRMHEIAASVLRAMDIFVVDCRGDDPRCHIRECPHP